MRKLLHIIITSILLTVLSLLAAACGETAASGPNPVHMSDTSFEQSSITIKKGALITLVNDTATIHIIENGTWDSSGNARAENEPGAPKVDEQIGGYGSQPIGPFNAAGSFDLYCTVHPGMKLKIMVT